MEEKEQEKNRLLRIGKGKKTERNISASNSLEEVRRKVVHNSLTEQRKGGVQ